MVRIRARVVPAIWWLAKRIFWIAIIYGFASTAYDWWAAWIATEPGR